MLINRQTGRERMKEKRWIMGGGEAEEAKHWREEREENRNERKSRYINARA